MAEPYLFYYLFYELAHWLGYQGNAAEYQPDQCLLGVSFKRNQRNLILDITL
jgi:hypothetical protein